MDMIEDILTWLFHALVDLVRSLWRREDEEALTELMHWLEVEA